MTQQKAEDKYLGELPYGEKQLIGHTPPGNKLTFKHL